MAQRPVQFHQEVYRVSCAKLLQLTYVSCQIATPPCNLTPPPLVRCAHLRKYVCSWILQYVAAVHSLMEKHEHMIANNINIVIIA